MGIVSEKEFDSELTKVGIEKPREESNSLTIPNAEIKDIPRGRGNGGIETPDSVRKLIGQTAIEDGRPEAVALATALGISPSSVSAYTAGATSTSSYNDRPNGNHIEQVKEKISKRARGKLMRALHHITDSKLSEAKPRDLAGIAKDMSVIFKNMESDGPKVPTGNSGPTFVFYSPQFRKEEVFEVVQAKE